MLRSPRATASVCAALMVCLALALPCSAQAQTPMSPRERITTLIEILRATPAESTYRAQSLLLDLMHELDPKNVDEKLVDGLISMIDDQRLRSDAMLALRVIDKQEVTRKAVPKLLEILPEEDCKAYANRDIGGGSVAHFARLILHDMAVQGRTWSDDEIVPCSPKALPR